jgi:beta-glucosidase/6-phospho-beta-glucosidase/beta-galactosidase
MGYMAWSLFADFDGQMGYKMRFGLVFVDFVKDGKLMSKASCDRFRTVANGQSGLACGKVTTRPVTGN